MRANIGLGNVFFAVPGLCISVAAAKVWMVVGMLSNGDGKTGDGDC